MTVKYNLEKQINNSRSLVDFIDHVSYRNPITLTNTNNTIDIDLSKSNYFVIDMDTIYHKVSLSFLNYSSTHRFEIMFIKPRRRVIFEYPFGDYEVLFPWGERNGLNMGEEWNKQFKIISYSKYNVNNIPLFMGIDSGWIRIE